MDCELKYHFIVAETEVYQNSMHFQTVTNYYFITRDFMMCGNTMQRTGYQPVRQYIFLQVVQGTPTQSRSVLTHSYRRLKTVQVHNTDHVFTHIQLPRPFSEVQCCLISNHMCSCSVTVV